MRWVNWIGFSAGVVIVASTLLSVTSNLVVPRRSRGRLSRLALVAVAGAFHLGARRAESYARRDRILAYEAPVALLALLVVWVIMLFCGFMLLFWPFSPGAGLGSELSNAFTLSGSSLFTLGFARGTSNAPLLTFFAAGAGLTVVALEIGYLPVIYGAFNRRETLVTMLDARAGSPPWGPEILARHELVDNVESLADLYSNWEEWAADLTETHTTYSALIFFRSPTENRSWVIGLLAILDAAALHLATRPLTAPAGARPLIRMGYVALRDVGRTLGLSVNDDPMPDDPLDLSREDFDGALDHLGHAGWRLEVTADEAWVHFRGWRVTYEDLALRIADIIDAPPAYWSGPRHRLPEAQTPPTRPPHRKPTPQVQTIREVTHRRRVARGVEDGVMVELDSAYDQVYSKGTVLDEQPSDDPVEVVVGDREDDRGDESPKSSS